MNNKFIHRNGAGDVCDSQTATIGTQSVTADVKNITFLNHLKNGRVRD